SVPFASASSIIFSPIRSLTLPPGFIISSLARTRPFTVHDLRQLDERCIPDRLEDVGKVAHGHRGGCKTVDVIRTYAPGPFTSVGDAFRLGAAGDKPGRAGGGSRTPRKPICSRSH